MAVPLTDSSVDQGPAGYPDGVMLLDRHHADDRMELIALTATAARMIGLTAECTGDINTLLPPDLATALHEACRACLASNTSISSSTGYVCVLPTTPHTSARCQLILWTMAFTTTTTTRLVGVLHALDTSSRDGHPLADAYRTIVENLPNYISRYDTQGRILYHNQNLGALGFPHKEVLNKTVTELAPGSASAARYHHVIMQVATSGQPADIEVNISNEDSAHSGRHQIRLVPEFDSHGTLHSVLAIGHDITALKQAIAQQQSLAERLKLAQEIAQFGVITLGVADKEMQIDDRIRAIYGYARDQVVTEAEFRRNFRPDDYRLMSELWQQAVASGTTYSLTFPISRTDGESRWIEARIAPRSDQGAPSGLIAVHWDITARKRAEEQREQLEVQLRQVQKMEAIGTLVGGIAHDFNNILAAIMGNAALLEHAEGVPPDMHADIQEIAKAATRGKSLVQRLLAFGRPQEPCTQYCDLHRIAEEVTHLLRPTIPASVALTLTVNAELPAVLIDATQISQVILNLGVNAYQAMRNKSGTIDITLSCCNIGNDNTLNLAAGAYVLLAVRDDGTGMSAAVRERIFDPFFTTKPAGSGLGLAVVHGIVRAHNGAITVDSIEGRGTVFEIYLPALQTIPVTTVPSEKKNAKHAKPTGQRILYLDDEDMIVSVMQRYLEQLGYVVDGHTNAALAIEAFCHQPDGYDLVMTDFNMPHMSGLEVARTLLGIRPEICIILMSGYMLPHEVNMAIGMGIKAVIFKPDAMTDIAEKVHQVLHG